MVHSHHHLLLFSTFPFSLTTHPNHHLSPSLHFLHRSSTPTSTVSAIPSAAWLSDLTPQDFGPIQLPSSLPFSDDPSTVQVASTVLLTGALTVFLFRTVQRRIKRAKQLVYCLLLQYFCFNFLEMNRLKMSLWLQRFRSSGAEKSLERLKRMKSSSIKVKNRASADQALLGAVIAGAIAVVLYRFTTSIEASLSRQMLSDHFSVCILFSYSIIYFNFLDTTATNNQNAFFFRFAR